MIDLDPLSEWELRSLRDRIDFRLKRSDRRLAVADMLRDMADILDDYEDTNAVGPFYPKIPLIRSYRKASPDNTALGLKESKNAVEGFFDQLA